MVIRKTCCRTQLPGLEQDLVDLQTSGSSTLFESEQKILMVSVRIEGAGLNLDLIHQDQVWGSNLNVELSGDGLSSSDS